MVLYFIGVYAISSLLLRNVSFVRAALEYRFRVSVRPCNILNGSMGDKLLTNFTAKFISVLIYNFACEITMIPWQLFPQYHNLSNGILVKLKNNFTCVLSKIK